MTVIHLKTQSCKMRVEMEARETGNPGKILRDLDKRKHLRLWMGADGEGSKQVYEESHRGRACMEND